MDEKMKEILLAILNLIAEQRGPVPVSDEEFFAHNKLVRDLIAKL